MGNKYRIAAIIAACYFLVGIFATYGSFQLFHYISGDATSHVETTEEIFSAAFSLIVSSLVVFGLAALFTGRLQHAVNNYRVLFKKSASPLALFDLEIFQYIDVNKQFINISGGNRKNILKMFVPEAVPVRLVVTRLLNKETFGTLSAGKWVQQSDDADVVWEVTVSLVRWNGKNVGLMTLHDITARVHYEKQLLAINEELQQKVTLRTQELALANRELLGSNQDLNSANESLRGVNEQLSLVHARLRQKTDQLLQQREEKLNNILSSINEIVWSGRVQPDNSIKIEFMNQAIEKLIGLTVEERLQLPISFEEMAPGVKEFLTSSDRNKPGVYHFESENLIRSPKTNEEKWILQNTVIKVNQNGELLSEGTVTDITERKNAELEIRRQQKMLQELIDNLPVMVTLIGPDNTIQYANNKFQYVDTHGKSLSEFIGKKFTDFTTHLTNENERLLEAMYARESEWVDFESNENGQTHQLRWMRLPTTNGSYIHVGYDVTENRKLQVDLKKNQEMLQAIVDNLPQFVLATGQDQRYRFANKSFRSMYCRMVGGNPDNEIIDVLEKDFIESTYVRQNANQLPVVKRLLETPGESIEVSFQSDSGETIYIQWYRIALPDGGFLKVGQDITPRKKLMIDLKQQHEMLQTLIENLPLKILFVDNDRTIKFINANFATKGSHVFVGKKLDSLMEASLGKKTGTQILDRLFSRPGEWFDFQATNVTGEELFDSWTTVPLSNGSHIAIGQDIRIRKRAEEEKNKLMEQLIMQNNDLMQFSYIASHNLRGPVASMLGLINLMNYQSTSAYTADILEGLQLSVQKLDTVIKDMNSILELRNTTTQPNEQINIANLIHDILHGFDSEFKFYSVQVTSRIQVEDIYTVKSYLQSIIFNLISNALKYRVSGRTPTIDIVAKKTKKHIEISVADNGKGIDLDRFKEKLFLLYQRFDTEVNGKGLGLFMAKTQAEAIGGKITVRSELESGSTFTLTLPINVNTPINA